MQEIRSDSEFALWVKVSKTLFSTDIDVFIGIVYVPPDGSKYFDESQLQVLEDEISDFCLQSKYTL